MWHFCYNFVLFVVVIIVIPDALLIAVLHSLGSGEDPGALVVVAFRLVLCGLLLIVLGEKVVTVFAEDSVLGDLLMAIRTFFGVHTFHSFPVACLCLWA